MRILPEPLSFEWDKGNLEKNFKKHKVSNKEAEEIFINESLIISEDAKHSGEERRFQGLGKTDLGKLLFLSFTVRKDKIRVISARDMNKKEEVVYEKIKKHT